ncbi:hypothetical protein [Roseimarinus sediminis]|uniref:hypothetical protein n=1 Tax=Roseimarinus sediminis TaxID=1610899 RepID=UPI003D260497
MEKENDYLQEIPDSEDINTDAQNLGFYIEHSKYHINKSIKGSGKEIALEISNFVGRSLFNLDDGSNVSKRILLIQRHTGETYLLEIPTSDMKLETFETILKSKQCTFYGNRYELNRIFSHWMDEEQQANAVAVLGYNSAFNLYAFTNAAFCFESRQLLFIDELGIVQANGKNYYLPANGKANINNGAYEHDRKFFIQPGKLGFEGWTKLFFDAYGNNGALAIDYLVLALFWDIVFDHVGSFPFLFLFGAFGTGKTSLVESLLRLFGRDYIGIPLNNASQVGLSRTIASRNNTIFYLKEYTQESDQYNQDLILTAYDGSGRTTGVKSNDNRTQVATVKSAIIFDGNHLPAQNSAVLSRMILLNFENNRFSKIQLDAYNQLKAEQEEGLGQVLVDVLQQRDYFARNFRPTFDAVLSELREADVNDFPERNQKHVALILTPIKLLETKLSFPFDYCELKEIALENAREHTKIQKQTDERTIFWDAFAYNLHKGNLVEFSREVFGVSKKNSHYHIKRDVAILQIRYSEVYQEYVRYCKNSNQKFIDKSTLKRLLTSKAYQPFIPNTQKGRGDAYTDAAFGSCYQFSLESNGIDYSIDGVTINL